MEIRNLIKNRENDLFNRSTKATCGAFEREIVVRNDDVAATKASLRKKGFFVVGTSEPNGSTRKVWFVRSGLGFL